jgi:hypothetical protein
MKERIKLLAKQVRNILGLKIMNERIRTLRQRATLTETYKANDGTIAEAKSVNLEKFAELIVCDCAKLIEDVHNKDLGLYLKFCYGIEK